MLNELPEADPEAELGSGAFMTCAERRGRCWNGQRSCRTSVSGSLAIRSRASKASYNRHDYTDEKRKALEALGGTIDRIVNPQANVVPLGAAQ